MCRHPSLLFSWKSGANKERLSHCSCNSFYWFALVTLAIPTSFLVVLGVTMAKMKNLELRVLPGERAVTRLETTLRSQARGPGLMLPLWWRPPFSGPPTEAPPFKGLWRPKVSMVVTTVSHCFWTILDGARFYDDGDGLEGSPRGCTWRAGSIRGLTSRPRECWRGCSPLGTGSPRAPSQGGLPCLYLEQR